jgi:hypothetical protein
MTKRPTKHPAKRSAKTQERELQKRARAVWQDLIDATLTTSWGNFKKAQRGRLAEKFPKLDGRGVQRMHPRIVNVSFNVTQEVAAALPRASRHGPLWQRRRLRDDRRGAAASCSARSHNLVVLEETVTLKLHPRSSVVQKARLEFDQFLFDLEQKHQLTYGELFSMLGNSIANLAKYQIRSERHPNDPDKRGDEA